MVLDYSEAIHNELLADIDRERLSQEQTHSMNNLYKDLPLKEKVEFIVKDSGERQQFNTGAVRDLTKGKGSFFLLSPIAIRRLAKHYENGAKKYDARNWEKGIVMSRYLDSALRHLFDYMEGLREEDNLAACLWNVAGLIHTEEMVRRGLLPKELDDLNEYLLKYYRVKPEPETTD